MGTKKRRKNLEPKYIILIIIGGVILLLSIFAFIIKDKRNLSKPEQILKDSIIFVENIVLWPFKYIGNEISELINLKDVYKENQILKSNLERYDLIYTQNNELKKEIKALKEEMNIDYMLTEYEYLKATVVNRNVGYWYDTITINKGSNDGIEKDMAVITSKGLIGKVTKTTNFNSDVKLITSNNSNNKISVIINNDGNELYGILNGYDNKNNTLSVEGISDNSEIKQDSIVYTSGLNDLFPSGIIIGKVKNVEKDNYGLSKNVNVTPTNNMSDITVVSILKRKDNK